MHLVDRLKDKQESALIELMNQYGDYLVRTAYLLLKDHQTAEEAVQDTFVIAYEKIRQLEDPAKLKSWLTAIVMNCCRTRMRRWSWKNIILAFESDEIHEDETTLSPEEELMEWIWNANLSEAIHELDYKYREVITLFYFNEMKISEIAEYTKEKENTIKSRLKRARLKLKDILVKGEEFLEENESAIKRQTR
ncbi:sigma-70 family RNA polymerase sigma factor [Ornithinibacillus massiliensis]|uniref:Sigma-70 family RNA polymerase sigma factor n=1 Tax=Ornithinibacillus massiliensis TaxID=1944633 RepID=A0ABS5MIC7_9BACI|nr:sigma-70 family RNA polymerase sigma factor [Ornithinibacillus massiliensis]MBS3682096.1 sigma-70 family RNA polymerase sigma factor [Ornithinibacillus massiliensis]